MWHNQLTFQAPTLFLLGFLMTFFLDVPIGVLVALPAIDRHFHDTYFVGRTSTACCLARSCSLPTPGLFLGFPKDHREDAGWSMRQVPFMDHVDRIAPNLLVHYWLGNMGMPCVMWTTVPLAGLPPR